MRINATVLRPTNAENINGAFRVRLVAKHQSEEDIAENLRSLDDMNFPWFEFTNLLESSFQVSDDLHELANDAFSKGYHYWRASDFFPDENDMWKTNLEEYNMPNNNPTNINAGNSYMIFGAYEFGSKLYFLGFFTRGNYEEHPVSPFKADHYQFIMNPKGQFLAYDRLSDTFDFETLELISGLSMSEPEPRFSLTDIEQRQTDLSLVADYEDRPGSDIILEEHELLNSVYIKPAIAEILANNPNVTRIQVFQNLTDMSRDNALQQISGYTIPDEIVRLRNEVANFPRIDNQGKYIDEPEDFMPDTYAYENLPKDPFKISNETKD